MDEEEHESSALRVSQLDAAELDSELHGILKTQVYSVFKYFPPGLLTKIEPEINALLRLILWKFSVHTLEATVGQQLLGLKYKNTRASVGKSHLIGNRQKVLYAVLLIGGQWLQERSHDIRAWTRNVPYTEKVHKILDKLQSSWRVASVVNFLVFLQEGKFQFLLERILGIQAVFPKKQEIRQVSFEYMSRELLWHGFAEFLFFALPLINYQRLKNYIQRKLISTKSSDLSQSRCMADYKECVICGNWPYNPHHIGCKHVFCYFCIKGNVMTDPSYCCPVCGCSPEKCNDEPVIHEVQMKR